jgi:hypothetical protein
VAGWGDVQIFLHKGLDNPDFVQDNLHIIPSKMAFREEGNGHAALHARGIGGHADPLEAR